MDEIAENWGRLAWTQLWQVTLLVAGVWLVLRLVGRNRPHLACALWLVVLLKCVTPPLVSSPSGIFCWLQRIESHRGDDDEPLAAAPPTLTALSSTGVGPAPDEPTVVVQARPLPVIDAPSDLSRTAAAAAVGEASESTVLAPEVLWPQLLWAAATVWLTGTLAFAVAAAVRFLTCWRKLLAATPTNDPALVQLVESLKSRLKLRHRVRLLVTDSPLGPAVVGLWRPTIVLPSSLVRGKTPCQLEPLVAHELIHIRRGDLWISLLQTLAVGLWWFHPLVRLASRLVTREAERCCDEETIAQLGCRPADYARSLLDVLALKQQLSPIPAFPGVRPVDVTSLRLERIMQLGQGCHKRTPWWCWLAMLALALAVLPGAALVVGAKEKPPQELLPWPALNFRNSAPGLRPADAEEKLETRDYDVTSLLAKLKNDGQISGEQAKQYVTDVIRTAVQGTEDVQWAREGVATVRQSIGAHDRIKSQLDVLNAHGHAELAIEVRIISGPKAVLNAAEVNWRMIGGGRSEEPSPVDRRPGQAPLPAAGTAQVRLVDDDSDRREFSGAAVSVIEKNVPAMLALVDDAQAEKLIESAQADRGSNVLQAPKVTLFNGQTSRIEDLVQRPFVVSVTPVPEVDKTALKPNIKVFSEGTTIRLRPVATKDGPIQLDFDLTLSSIRDVDTVDFPTAPGQEPITVQVPEVASTRLSTTAQMHSEQTLIFSVPKIDKGKKEQQPMCVLVKVTKLQAPKDEATPSPEKTTTALQGKVTDRHAAQQFTFESSGWRLKFAPKDGGKLEFEQADARGPLAKLSIRGGVRLDASAEGHGKGKADRIQAEADAVQVATRPAKDEAPARLEISLDGNVRLMHNESRMEAGRVVLQIDDPFLPNFVPSRKPAGIRMQVDGARSIELPSKYYFPDDVQYFQPAPTKPDGGLVEKIYPVADLVIPVPTGPITISASGSLVKRDAPAVAKPDFDSLIELITTTIRPDSWDKVGGNGEISIATSSYSLVIRQEEQVHKQIAEVLNQLRRLQDIQVVLTLQRLEVSAAELEKSAAGNTESPLRSLAENPKSRVWSLKPDSIAKLTGLPGGKLHSGPKVTTFNGQSVDLWLADGEQRRDNLLTGLTIQPLVTADFRSLRLQVLGDTAPRAETTAAAADKLRTTLDLAIAHPSRSRQLPMELRELVLGQVLVVDESQYAWQEHDEGVPVVDKLPGTARVFRNASAKKPAMRHFYLITPNVLVASEEEDKRILAPRKE